MKDKSISYDQMLTMVKNMVVQRESGTLCVRTPDGRLAIIVVKSGEIVFLSFGAKRGMTAIPLICGITQGTFRLNDTAATLDSNDLPKTREILQLLQTYHDVATETVQEVTQRLSEADEQAIDLSTVQKSLCFRRNGDRFGCCAHIGSLRV